MLLVFSAFPATRVANDVDLQQTDLVRMSAGLTLWWDTLSDAVN